MCGRYALFSKNKIKDKFNVEINVNFNISPNTDVLVIDNSFGLKFIKWGFYPSWSQNKLNIINARSETLYNKPSFKNTLKCVFIADGYYEWKKDKDYKKPFYHYLKSDFLYFAGIYNITSGCCIVTTKSNTSISLIHERQPMLLLEKDIKSWLNNSYDLSKTNSIEVIAHEVNTKVNNPINNDKNIINPIHNSIYNS